jgi:hypothetical protein
MNPTETDTFTITIPRQLAVWALQTISPIPATARQAIIDDYPRYLAQFTTRSPEQSGRNTTWSQNPFGESCNQVALLGQYYTSLLNRIRPIVQDLSGTVYTAMIQKDDNLRYQLYSLTKCKKVLTEDCKALASQDDILQQFDAPYSAVNSIIIEAEVELTERIKLINEVLTRIGCQTLPIVTTLTDGPPKGGLGYIDNELLNLKLQEMSPYYISPGTLEFVTKLLVDRQKLDEQIERTKATLQTVDTTLDSIASVRLS